MAELPAVSVGATTDNHHLINCGTMKIISDVQDCVQELQEEYVQCLIPIDDDNQKLQRFCYKLEYLLHCDQKDKISLLSNRKDYWDYFVKCLASKRLVNDGIKFVKSVTEFRTSLGRGRAFLRFCLIHQCLADTLQQCFQNIPVTRAFYRDTSPLLSINCTSRLISSLYELSEVAFDLSPYGYDLDVTWPTFARRSFPMHQSYTLWRAPSRTMSMSSLVSTPQQQTGREELHGSFALKDESEDGDRIDNRLSMDRASMTDTDELSIEKSSAIEVMRCRLEELEVMAVEHTRQLELSSEQRRANDEQLETSRRATEHILQLESQLENLTAKCVSLEKHLLEKQCVEDSLNDQLTGSQYERQSLTEQLAKWKQLVSGYVERVAVKERVNEQLEKQVKALREATDALREMMQLRTSECTALRNLVQELKTRVERGDTDVDNGNARGNKEAVENNDHRRQLECLEADKASLTALVNKLRDRVCELESEKSQTPISSDCDENVDVLKVQVEGLNQELEGCKIENNHLQDRLEVFRGWMSCVGNAESELDLLICEQSGEGDEKSSSACGGEERSDPEGMGEGGQDTEPLPALTPSIFSEDSSIIASMQRILNRLQGLITDRRNRPIKTPDDNTAQTSEINADHSLVTQVKKQAEQLTTVTMELSEATALVDQLRAAFTTLQTSEAVLRYELGEKRTIVDRLRKQLESSRSQWTRIRQKHSESEQDFLSLRAEFASRSNAPTLTSQNSEESACGCEELINDAVLTSSPSPEADQKLGCVLVPTAIAAESDEPLDIATPVSESPSTSSNYDEADTTRQSRLRLMEEQCRLLYDQLLQSRKKSELLEWKLARLHVKHGGASSDATTESDEPVEESVGLATEDEEEEEVVQIEDDDNRQDVDGDHADTSVPEPVVSMKPCPLALAQALPRRIVKLKRENENLTRDVNRLRRAQQLSEEESANGVDVVRDGLKADLERARATLVEFKRRVELVMRKEREEKEARYRVAVESKRELQLKVEHLENEVHERQGHLERLEGDVRRTTEEWSACRLGLEQEVNSLRFRLGSETLAREQASKHHARHESDVALLTDRLAEHERLVAALEGELACIRNERHAEIEHQNARIDDLQLCLNTREDECTVLNNELKETTRRLDEERNANACLRVTADEALAECTQLRSRFDEALTDSNELQKKIIKLIKEKDRLWQRSEHLSFQQKIQATDRWLKDDEAKHCLACRAEFTIVLRKHHCRLCGRIFCFNCCNHWAMTASSSRRVRVCNECIIRHSHIDNLSLSLENEDSEDDCCVPGIRSSTSGVPLSHSPSTCSDSAVPESPSSNSNEIAQDMTDPCVLMGSLAEEAREQSNDHCLNIAQSSPSLLLPGPSSSLPLACVDGRQSLGESSQSVGRNGGSVLGRLFASWSSSLSKGHPSTSTCLPNDDEFCVIDDDEIMKSLSGSSPYWPLEAERSDPSVYMFPMRSIDEIVEEFERGLPREVWVDAGKTCAVPILIEKRNTLTWAFTTEPKSIVFTLVFHSNTRSEDNCDYDKGTSIDNQLQTIDGDSQPSICTTHVLVPRTHCDSHLHPVHGKLVAKRPGIYTLYFDNGFSRFTAKKVKFIVRVNKDEKLANEQPNNADEEDN